MGVSGRVGRVRRVDADRGRCPDPLAASVLASARRSSLTGVVAAHTRGVADVEARAEAIRTAAKAWADFWDGHLDLDALAWEVTEHPTDMDACAHRIARAAEQAQRYWSSLYGDDPLLLSVPGIGPMTAPTIRAFLVDASMFTRGEAAASHVGMTPSIWSSTSGTVVKRSRAITKEGPAVLRLAFYKPRAAPEGSTLSWPSSIGN